jgi:Acyl-CoA synthetases (AMP-forming)/AMP-acid ligases II
MMDEEGFVFIRGRLKDMIVTGGQNVHAAEVEKFCWRFPASSIAPSSACRMTCGASAYPF